MTNEELKAALIKAFEQNNLPNITQLIKGVDKTIVDTTDSRGNTLLSLAVMKGYTGIVTYFIDVGADINKTSDNLYTPLHLATIGGSLSIVKLLVEKEALINTVNNHSWTPLHSAASYGYLEIVKLLIQKGANVNQTDKYNKSALWKAAFNAQFNTVKFFIENGADAVSLPKSTSIYDGIQDKNIIALLNAQEYADRLSKFNDTTKIELNSEQKEIVTARLIYKIKSTEGVDLNEVATTLRSKVAEHPVLTKVIEFVEELKAGCSSKDTEVAETAKATLELEQANLKLEENPEENSINLDNNNRQYDTFNNDSSNQEPMGEAPDSVSDFA